MKRLFSLVLALLLLCGSFALADGNISISPGSSSSEEENNSGKDENNNSGSMYTPKVEVGEYITFGSYEQNNSLNDGKEPIEWLVLAVEGNKVLVISRYGLANQPYNKNSAGQTWSNCDLRTWLNGTFYRTAFSEDERNAILTTNVDESASQASSMYPPSRLGDDTKDKVFLLSYAEAAKYLKDLNVRKCAPTAKAVKDGGNKSDGAVVDGKRTCWYWLRSPAYKNNAMCVDWDGTFATCYISHTYGVVRPSMWISLSGL